MLPPWNTLVFPCRTRAGRLKNSAFTLVEMLVVMLVIGALLALLVPNVKNLIGGRAVEQSINNVTGILEIGRARAIANRTYVWVLFSNATSSNNNELKCAAVMSLNGLNGLTAADLPNLRPITKLVTISNVKNVKYTQMPAALQNITPTDLKTDDCYTAGLYNPEGSSDFPDVVVGGYHFKGASFIRFNDNGEIGTSGDTYNLLVQPIVCLGLVKTIGATVPVNSSDGAVVACYGGTSKLSVFRP